MYQNTLPYYEQLNIYFLFIKTIKPINKNKNKQKQKNGKTTMHYRRSWIWPGYILQMGGINERNIQIRKRNTIKWILQYK